MKNKIDQQLLKMLLLRFSGTFGSGMLDFAIGLYILKQTGSALSMGISLITGPLVSLVLTHLLATSSIRNGTNLLWSWPKLQLA
ncbi:hypothetical protein [Lapidilactobacillus bayanensis]|uniref:hypothetical protein n=1 Tax=Lapidilactobacillus bayanensis TaxID=2485998 RepID=UPI000F782314|nr:hypothetical protein [Lapidilactobacillus bayanensis]